MQDSDMIKCRYVKLGRGHHLVVGPATRKPYGYRGQGDIFLVHRDDVRAGLNWFQPIQDDQPELVVKMPAVQAKVAPPPPEIVAPARDERGGGQPDYDEFVRAMIEGRDVAPAQAAPEETPGAEAASPEEGPAADAEAAVAAVMRGTEAPVEGLPPPANFELQLVPGVTEEIAEQMKRDGVVAAEDIVAQGADGLQKYRGVGTFKAGVIYKAAKDWLDAAA